jgi:hypothetical protein
VQQAMEDYELAIKQDVVTMKQLNKLLKTINYQRQIRNGLSDTNDLLEADVEQLGSQKIER